MKNIIIIMALIFTSNVFAKAKCSAKISDIGIKNDDLITKVDLIRKVEADGPVPSHFEKISSIKVKLCNFSTNKKYMSSSACPSLYDLVSDFSQRNLPVTLVFEDEASCLSGKWISAIFAGYDSE